MKTLMLITHRRLDAEQSGSKTYLRRMIGLAQEAGFRVRIVCLPATTFSSRPWGQISAQFSEQAEIVWPGTLKLGETFWSLTPSIWMKFGWRIGQEMLTKLKLGPASWRRIKSNLATVPPETELARMRRIIMEDMPDSVMVEYSALGPVLKDLPGTLPKSLLVHDSFAARHELFQSRNEPSDYPDPPSFAEEAARMSDADFVFHASVNELERFEGLLPASRHIWFRPTAPLHRNKLATRPTAQLLYIGANQQGSRDAITHFLTDIWPMVRAGAPNTELNIVGPVGRTISKELITDGVNILGRVEHLTDFAGPDMIGLLPTQLMSGISIKVGEYLGMGVPIVAYPAGIDGYGAALSGIVQLADTPDRFAAQTLALLSDRDARRTISQAGLEAAETVLQNPDVVEALRGLRPD